MTIEEGLFAYLSGRPEITNVIGSSPTRFYPVVAPQNPTAPFVTYARADGNRERAGSGFTGVTVDVYNLTCWAETYPAAAALARLLRNELDGAKGWWGDIELGSVQADDKRDDYNGDLQIFGRLVVLTIQYREA